MAAKYCKNIVKWYAIWKKVGQNNAESYLKTDLDSYQIWDWSQLKENKKKELYVNIYFFLDLFDN